METVKNRREYMAVSSQVSIVHPQSRRLLDRGAKDTPVRFDIVQIGCQILRRDQVQFLQRTGLKIRHKLRSVMGHYLDKSVDDISGTFCQKVVHRFVVQMKANRIKHNNSRSSFAVAVYCLMNLHSET